jgi:hypothetical protein
MHAEWYADLVAGALRDKEVATGLVPLYQVSLDAHSPDGASVPVDAGLGDMSGNSSYPDPTVASLQAGIAAGASQANVTLDSVKAVHADTAAVEVRATAHDPVAFVASHLASINALLKSASNLEGNFVEVDDSNGKPVFIAYQARRAGTGAVWFRPDLNPRQFATPSAG